MLRGDLYHSTLCLKMLALMYQETNRPADALKCWSRYRLLQLAYGIGNHVIDPVDMARLRVGANESRLPGKGPLNVPFVLVAGDAPTNFDYAAQFLASWKVHPSEEPYLAIVAPVGKEIAALDFELPVDDMTLECWCGGSQKRAPTRVPLDVDGSQRSGTEQNAITIHVPYSVDVVFARLSTGISPDHSLTIRSNLRQEGAGDALPWATLASEPIDDSDLSDDAPFSYFPCWIVDEDNRRVNGLRTQPSATVTSLCRLSDGKFLLAHTDDSLTISRIVLSSSHDGIHWSKPWSFPYNRTFTTRSPKMLPSDDGRIWMVYTSVYGRVNNRSRLTLWCTSSNDGHDWTEPEPLDS